MGPAGQRVPTTASRGLPHTCHLEAYLDFGLGIPMSLQTLTYSAFVGLGRRGRERVCEHPSSGPAACGVDPSFLPAARSRHGLRPLDWPTSMFPLVASHEH